jgi:hypothetical protein
MSETNDKRLNAWACDREGHWFYVGVFDPADAKALAVLQETYPAVAFREVRADDAVRKVRDDAG